MISDMSSSAEKMSIDRSLRFKKVPGRVHIGSFIEPAVFSIDESERVIYSQFSSLTFPVTTTTAFCGETISFF